ncbi:MAG: YidC/Oxa1 family insertase periplasmic-domain containing protein [Holophagales bacterium]|jgi:YidC/Oxa1 family membrane protein insertase|nr:YidC/Oxa1 family insertase periplasmic-domain containing protein [Holophagales bacterium]
MSDKKNLIFFVLFSMILLFGYSWLTKKNMPPPELNSPVMNPVIPGPAEVQPETNSVLPVPNQQQAKPAGAKSVPPQIDVEPIDRHARFIAGNDFLELTWRQYDGALIQATWKQYDTDFFPKEIREADGKLASAEFLGIGGAINTVFTGTPEVTEEADGKAITFSSQNGDRLTYYLPDDGFILDVNWHSSAKQSLYLIHSTNDIPQVVDSATGRTYPASPFKGLENGRVFTIEDKKIHAVKWDNILTDPWFKFLGRKRKELPPVASRLGLDAGIQTSKGQTAHYFTAIWDSSQMPQRDTAWYPGYHAAPDADGNAVARLYLGPKQAEHLAAFHPAGQPEKGKAFLQVMDFGFFGLIAKFLFIVLRYIQKFIPNWGWAITVFSLLVRLSLWSLNTKTTMGMLRQKDLEPYQKKIQAKYQKFGNDMAKKQEMQRELMAFYKKNGHNPMGSCLPILIQMPVFMALWSMLQNVFELRHAPWIFWIKDLSSSDPYFILPALMVGTMLIQQAITPPMGDPQQRKMMMVLMPVMMGFFFAYTPSGLTLYYLMFNIVGMGQTWWLMRNYKPQPVVL